MIHTDKYKKLHQLLRLVRNETETSQEELAERLNKPQSFVSKCETGERRVDLIELRDICNALNISLQDFIARFENMIS